MKVKFENDVAIYNFVLVSYRLFLPQKDDVLDEIISVGNPEIKSKSPKKLFLSFFIVVDYGVFWRQTSCLYGFVVTDPDIIITILQVLF